MSHRIHIIYLGPFVPVLCIRSWVDVSTRYKTQTPMSAYYCLSLGIRTPSKDSLLVAWIPGVQWVTLIVLGWHLASFQAWKDTEEC